MSRNKVPKRTQLDESYNVNKSNNHRNGRHIKDSHKKSRAHSSRSRRRLEELKSNQHESMRMEKVEVSKNAIVKRCDLFPLTKRDKLFGSPRELHKSKAKRKRNTNSEHKTH